MARDSNSAPYFSVSTIAVDPNKIDEAHACFAEIAEATMQEPGAKMYRYYQTQGKNEFVFIEKFVSREAYSEHVQSKHVREWASKYLNSGIFVGTFEFHPLSKEGAGIGGFDRP